MTPAQLTALVDVHEQIHGGDTDTGPKPSTNPAADIAALAAL